MTWCMNSNHNTKQMYINLTSITFIIHYSLLTWLITKFVSRNKVRVYNCTTLYIWKLNNITQKTLLNFKDENLWNSHWCMDSWLISIWACSLAFCQLRFEKTASSNTGCRSDRPTIQSTNGSTHQPSHRRKNRYLDLKSRVLATKKALHLLAHFDPFTLSFSFLRPAAIFPV